MSLPYELSLEAEQDLGGIFDYTAEAFGSTQAQAYLMAMETAFANLGKNPELGRERPEIRQGLRSMVHERHIIYYRGLSDRVRILRILHGSCRFPLNRRL